MGIDDVHEGLCGHLVPQNHSPPLAVTDATGINYGQWAAKFSVKQGDKQSD